MSDEIVWEDPPPASITRKAVWADRIAPLRAHPGEWAKFEGASVNTAFMIRKGGREGITAGEFEAIAANQIKYREAGQAGKCDMFVRFVGEPEKVRAVS